MAVQVGQKSNLAGVTRAPVPNVAPKATGGSNTLDVRVPSPREYANILDDVQSGLKSQAERMEAMQANTDFYRTRNRAYLEKKDAEENIDYESRPKRFSYLTRRVIRALTAPLYGSSPSRILGGLNDDGDQEEEESSQQETDESRLSPAALWLNSVYGDVNIDARLLEADRRATLNGVCAVQAVATGNPQKPIRLYLWGGQEFNAWCPADDPTTPYAICTVSVFFQAGKKRKRYQIWTADQYETYYTKAVTQGATTEGTRADQFNADESGPNPYGRIPFAFVHNEDPGDDFWDGGGIGDPLRTANQEIDRELCDLAQLIKAFACPDFFVRNADASFRYTKTPGRPMLLSGIKGEMGEERSVPEPFYLQPKVDVEQVWWDLTQYGNMVLEELDVPLAAVRADSSSDLSGIAIVAKMAPLLAYTKARQKKATAEEGRIAAMILGVGGSYYEKSDLLAASLDPQLAVTWPEPSFPLPSPERDAADKFEYDEGLTSKAEILAKRRGLTLAQAWEALERIAADRKREIELFGDVAGIDALTGPQPGGATQGGEDETAAEVQQDSAEADSASDKSPSSNGKPASKQQPESSKGD